MLTLQPINNGLGGQSKNTSPTVDLTRLLHDNNLISMGRSIGLLFDDLSFRLSKDFHVDHASILLAGCLPTATSICTEDGAPETQLACDLKVDSSTALLWFRQKELLQMLSARAAQGFNPLVINDTSKSAICKGSFNDNGTTRAYIGVPLRLPNTASFGYICLTHRHARHWHSREVAFLSQLAVAVTEEVALRLTLDQRTAHDSARFMRFYHLLLQANNLTANTNEDKNNRVNEVLNWLMAQSASMFKANHGFAYFAESELMTAENQASADMHTLASLSLDEIENASLEELIERASPPRKNGAPASAPIHISHQAALGSFQVYLPRHIQVQVGKGLSGQVWHARKAVVVDDYEKWTGRTIVVEKGRVRAMAGVPINVRENVCGVFGIGYADDRGIKNAELNGMERLANMAALVLP